MGQPLGKNITHMIVIQGIVDYLSIPAVFDQPGLPEGPQLVRDSGLGHPQESGNITDAELRMLQGAEDFNPGGVAENLEKIRQVQQNFVIRHLLPDFGDNLLVENAAIVLVRINYLAGHESSL
jgi:hypothetical protein